ncbi:MAG: DUF1003 domain-containing protein [Deltaproteobacteria bacterium]|nr:DUF1003 domain-containing protein [Deltaproteobacteria bacterium]
MDQKLRDIIEKLFRSKYEKLTDREKHVARHIAEKTHISRDVLQDYSEQLTAGERIADKVASFGGSWIFISIFFCAMVAWILLNSFILVKLRGSSDPYPYILLNLVLSMLAAIQAPVILMSQNRQSSKDRVRAEHDYEVNLKAELEIMELHEKIDALRDKQWRDLLSLQQEQMRLLSQLVENPNKSQHNAD